MADIVGVGAKNLAENMAGMSLIKVDIAFWSLGKVNLMLC